MACAAMCENWTLLVGYVDEWVRVCGVDWKSQESEIANLTQFCILVCRIAFVNALLT